MSSSTKTRRHASNGAAMPPARDKADERWNLRLYIAGQNTRSTAAISNLEKLCEEHLKGRYKIEVIDLLKNPKLAGGDQIIAVPTLVRRLPEPMRKIIGDLSDSARVLVGLDLKPHLGDGAGPDEAEE